MPAPVTSRAVRGHEDLGMHGDVQRGGRFVADQQVGIVGDRDRDDKLAGVRRRRKFVRKARAPVGLVDADELELRFDRPPPGGGTPGRRVMHGDGLGDLVADGVNRRQRRHRVLEHRADLRAPNAGELRVGPAEQFSCSCTDPDTVAYSGSSPTTAIAVADLPEPDSPTTATTLRGSTCRSTPGRRAPARRRWGT